MEGFRTSVPLVSYFVLNLVVTFTNKKILGTASRNHAQQPYLLTATHGVASFLGCTISNTLVGIRSRHSVPNSDATLRQPRTNLSRHQHVLLAIFSLFYTVNIALSNMSLAMVSLPLNQTVRATAPVLTVALTIFVLGRSPRTYSISTCISLLLVSVGVVIAASGTPGSRYAHRYTNTYGILITLLSALTAVLKTILTHKLMTSLSLRLSSIELLRILSPYASVQALSFAYYTGELGSYNLSKLSDQTVRTIKDHNHVDIAAQAPDGSLATMNMIPHRGFHTGTILLWFINAAAAFLLNISSFEANKTCGPVSMAVAANLKQIVILLAPYLAGEMSSSVINAEEVTNRVILGTFLTVIGGIWYAWEMARNKKKQKVVHAPSTVNLT